MKQLLIFFFLVQLLALVRGQCKLTVSQVRDEKRIVLIKIGYEYKVLNQDTINQGDTIYFVCTNIDTDSVAVTCGPNNQFSHQLPIGNCANPPKAVVEQIHGSGCRAKTYRVSYKFGNRLVELYRSCYDKEKLSTLVVEHFMHPYTLVTNRPDQSFTTDGVMTGKDAASYDTPRIYKRFEDLLGPNQNYIKSRSDQQIDRGHLAPSSDFLFPAPMRATFKYINVIPQFKTINRFGNWRIVEKFLQDKVGKVFTGAYGVLTLRKRNGSKITNVKMYLADNNRIPIPKWIYKHFQSSAASFTFFTYNNIYNDKPPAPPCNVINCPVYFDSTPASGFTFCCDPDDFFKNVYPGLH